MTLLPILGRELRMQARSQASYWGRVAVAAVGVLVCVPPMILSGSFAPPGAIGRDAFYGLVDAAFLLCCAACLLTADTISRERRQGTLVLLLLTRVRHFDVLLGKFASRGLASLLALVAFLPVLALPLLTGGVTGAEAARMAVALGNTLFLALSAGLWASARGFERSRTVRSAVLILTGLVLVPGLGGALLPRTHAGLASPLGTLFQAADLSYRASPGWYWLSLGLVQTFAWTLLLGAVARLRSRAGETEDGASPLFLGAGGASEPPAMTAPITKCRYCGRQNFTESAYCYECGTELFPKEPQVARDSKLSSATTPLRWLLSRQRGLKPVLWVAALIGFCHFAFFGMAGRFLGVGAGQFFVGVSWAFSLVSTAITGSLFAWVASRFFVEARRTGELELLLTTPLGAGHLVSAQWDILKRLGLLPVVVMQLPWLLQGLSMLSFGFRQPSLWKLYYVLSLLLSVANTVLSVGACCWLALWFGLRGMGSGSTILWTVLLANGLPYMLNLSWSMLHRLVIKAPGFPWVSWPLLFSLVLPQVATLLFFIWLVHLARRDLLYERAGAEPLDLRQVLSRATWRRSLSHGGGG